MRRSYNEKIEIIHLVEQSDLSVNRTLKELGIKRSTFYGWYKRYVDEGYEGLKMVSILPSPSCRLMTVGLLLAHAKKSEV